MFLVTHESGTAVIRGGREGRKKEEGRNISLYLSEQKKLFGSKKELDLHFSLSTAKKSCPHSYKEHR